jgi:alpha-beta hydrolase superfamily lysophospholipase
MAPNVAHWKDMADVNAVVRHLHGLVTYGPRDLDIAAAMSAQGYDAVKWAEGQGMLAELVSSDPLAEASVLAAIGWYEEAATAARQALASQPQLLDKLGVSATGCSS